MGRWFWSAGMGVVLLLLVGCGERLASIGGEVLDQESGAVVSGAIVSLGRDSVTSTQDGSYEILDVSAGELLLVANADGYERYQRRVAIKEETSVILDILLKPAVRGGSISATTWKMPPIEDLRKAARWGAGLDEGPEKLWTVCTTGPCTVEAEEPGPPRITVGTPICYAASMANTIGYMLDDALLADIQDSRGNRLTVFLVFEGSVWDLDAGYTAVILQGDIALNPYQSSVDWHPDWWDEGTAITLDCRFLIAELDPGIPFWFSASQEVGGKAYQFKIDPMALGTEGLF